MAWTFNVATGMLMDPEGKVIGSGYSGDQADYNTPADESLPDQGPVPAGAWTIGPFFDDPGGKGPVVADLTPVAGTETYGRAGFMVHGDNSECNHTGSTGCIVLARPLREAIAVSGDTVLVVT